MKKLSKYLLVFTSVVVVSLGLLFFLYRHNLPSQNQGVYKKSSTAFATASDNVYGWGWGFNFGWISLNCLNDYNGDGKITLASPNENYCTSGAYGVNIGSTGELMMIVMLGLITL